MCLLGTTPDPTWVRDCPHRDSTNLFHFSDRWKSAVSRKLLRIVSLMPEPGQAHLCVPWSSTTLVWMGAMRPASQSRASRAYAGALQDVVNITRPPAASAQTARNQRGQLQPMKRLNENVLPASSSKVNV
jgi:hypothetical protein